MSSQSQSRESLSYAVRPHVVAAYLGPIMFVLGGLSVPPLLVALLYREYVYAFGCAVSVLLLVATGAALKAIKGRHTFIDDVQTNEALMVVCAAFIVTPLVVTVPMVATGTDFLDALFETVSGITTTGLSTFASVQDKPASLIFEAAWLQWLGGVGIMILSFALLTGQSASAKRITSVLGQTQGLWGGTRAYASIVIRIYLGLTLVGILALVLAGSHWLDAATLAFAGVSTGGFAPFDSSIGNLPAAVQSIVIALCIAGAIPLPLLHDLTRRKWRDVLRDSELHALLIAGAVVAALLVGAAWMHGNGSQGWTLSLTAFSAQTTAGFAVTPIAGLDAFSKAVLIGSMVCGGGVGSSAGGLKLLRVLVLIRLIQLAILKSRLTPRAAVPTRIANRDWADDELVRALLLVGSFAGIVLLSWLPFLWAGKDPLDALFEVTSAIATAGLSTGLTGPALPPSLKGVLCLDMLLGRLEIFPILVLLAPRTWIGHRRELESAVEQREVSQDATGISRRDGAGGEDGSRADRSGS